MYMTFVFGLKAENPRLNTPSRLAGFVSVFLFAQFHQFLCERGGHAWLYLKKVIEGVLRLQEMSAAAKRRKRKGIGIIWPLCRSR